MTIDRLFQFWSTMIYSHSTVTGRHAIGKNGSRYEMLKYLLNKLQFISLLFKK
jgi:hypothetical protein